MRGFAAERFLEVDGATDYSAGSCERLTVHAVECTYVIDFRDDFMYCGNTGIVSFKSSESQKLRVKFPGEVMCLDDDGNILEKRAKSLARLEVSASSSPNLGLRSAKSCSAGYKHARLPWGTSACAGGSTARSRATRATTSTASIAIGGRLTK